MAVQVCNNVVASSAGRELAQHGSPMFPIACYADEHEVKFGFIGQEELLAVAKAISRCIL